MSAEISVISSHTRIDGELHEIGDAETVARECAIREYCTVFVIEWKREVITAYDKTGKKRKSINFPP